MMKIRPIQGWRRLVRILHALILPGIPFLKINGESALRFDISSLRLYFFGTVLWMDEFFIVLIASLFFTFSIVFVTVVFGRIWCGWLCPQTVLSDMTGVIEKIRAKGLTFMISGYAWVFLLSTLVGASLIWYFVSPYEFFKRLMNWSLGSVIWGFWIVLTGIVFLNLLFLRRRFCASVCPYAKMQGMLFDNKTLTIAFDHRRKDECMDCRACVQVCPVHIDIRKGASIACIQCAECVDKCGDIFSKKGKKGLINYFWGEPDSRGGIIRQNAIITGALTILSLIFLVYLGTSRTPIDITIIPSSEFQPRISADNRLINSFIIAIENRQDKEETILINMPEGFKIIPDVISLKPGELKKIKVFISGSPDANDLKIRFIPEATKRPLIKEVNLLRP